MCDLANCVPLGSNISPTQFSNLSLWPVPQSQGKENTQKTQSRSGFHVITASGVSRFPGAQDKVIQMATTNRNYEFRILHSVHYNSIITIRTNECTQVC